MQNLDVVGIQIETLCQQRAQFARPADVFQRVSQLDYPTPFIRGGRSDRVGARYEVCVVLGGHGSKGMAADLERP